MYSSDSQPHRPCYRGLVAPTAGDTNGKHDRPKESALGWRWSGLNPSWGGCPASCPVLGPVLSELRRLGCVGIVFPPNQVHGANPFLFRRCKNHPAFFFPSCQAETPEKTPKHRRWALRGRSAASDLQTLYRAKLSPNLGAPRVILQRTIPENPHSH